MSDDQAERPRPDESPDSAAPGSAKGDASSGEPDAPTAAPTSPWLTPPGAGAAAPTPPAPTPPAPTPPLPELATGPDSVDADATQVAPRPDPDASRTAGPVDADATRIAETIDPDAPRIGTTTDPDATRVAGAAGADATRPIPPVEARVRPRTPDPTTAIPTTPPTWRGQSGVPTHERSDSERSGNWGDPPPDDRSWLMPVVIGVVGVLVLAAVAFGLVAALRNTSKPAPGPTAPIATPTQAVVTTAPPSVVSSPSAPSSPSVLPSDSTAYVIVPSTLEGIVFTYAEEELNALGLKYALQPEVSTAVPADTVIRTNPAGGQLVVPGTTIVIVYAVVPTPSVSSPPPVTPSPSVSVSSSPN